MLRQTVLRLLAIGLAAALVPACGGDGSDRVVYDQLAGPGFTPQTSSIDDDTSPYIDPAANPNRSIITMGGRGTVGAGGNGGFQAVQGLVGSNIRILRTGTVLATFTVPDDTVNLGTNPRTVAASTTWDVGDELTAGVSTVLGDDGINVATGLHVLPGVTLVLEPQFDNAAPPGADQMSLIFVEGVLVEGTLVTGFRDGSSASHAHLNLVGRSVVLGPGSSVNTAGEDVPAGNNGGGGGNIRIQGNPGSVICRGTLRANGGDGDIGGNAGQVLVFSNDTAIYFQGAALESSGGTGNAGVGGNGNSFWLVGATNGGGPLGGGVFFEGTTVARGGDGDTGGGTSGNLVINETSLAGPIVFSGTGDFSGGNALTSGNGGQAAGPLINSPIGIFTRSGDIRMVGSLIARGGDGAGAGNGGISQAGFIWREVDGTAGTSQPIGGGMYLSLDIDQSGGAGAVGGASGGFQVLAQASGGATTVIPGQSPIWLVGYSQFNTSGGGGATNGGNAGSCSLRNRVGFDPGGNPWLGSLWNEVDVVARGGDGGTGFGGNGGATVINTDAVGAQNVAPFLDRRFINSGTFDLRGGDGATNGGNGGAFTMRDTFRVENVGDVTTTGGLAGSGLGGIPGAIAIRSDGVTVNQADLVADGGNSTAGQGRNGTSIFVEGRTATHQGLMSSRGGTSGGAFAGGSGGGLEIGSWDGTVLSVVSGTLGVQLGTGTPDGFAGIVTIDGIRRALTAGILTLP